MNSFLHMGAEIMMIHLSKNVMKEVIVMMALHVQMIHLSVEVDQLNVSHVLSMDVDDDVSSDVEMGS